MLRHIFHVAVISLLTLPAVACSTNPATGKMQLNSLSEPQEIQLGTEAQPQFIEQSGGLVPDQPLRDYVSNLGSRLAKLSERPDLPWEFNVLNSDQINAFALPGGKIFITRGLLSQMSNEAQLAGVLGHEIGHVNAEHIGQQMTRASIISAGVAILGAATDKDWLVTLGGATGGIYMLSFSRDQESQADELGVRYMTKAGYNPQAQIQVMQILQKASGNGGSLEIFQTHPNPGNRIKDLQKLIPQQYAYTQNNPQFVFNEQPFQTNVLSRLKNLPPAPKKSSE
ncbi:MAG: M48 family metalloprotease [Phycisphaerales bacterium]